MLKVRCKMCNKELCSTPKVQCCGCSNQMVIVDDKVTASDLSKVVMLNTIKNKNNHNVLSSQDLKFQEDRKRRRVRKLDFEER